MILSFLNECIFIIQHYIYFGLKNNKSPDKNIRGLIEKYFCRGKMNFAPTSTNPALFAIAHRPSLDQFRLSMYSHQSNCP